MKRLALRVWPSVSLLLLAASLALLSAVTADAARFGRLYSVLLVLNIVGLVVLGSLISSNMYRLWRQYRDGVGGSRLTARLVGVFVLLAVLPVLAVFGFSMQFLNRGIDNWFNVQVDHALESSLELGRSALDLRMRELLKQTREAAAALNDMDDDVINVAIGEVRANSGAEEVLLLGQNGRIIAMESANPSATLPQQPDAAILQQVRAAGAYVGLDPAPGAGLNVRVVLGLPQPGRPRILQALYPMDHRVNELSRVVQSAFAEYREMAYLRQPLQYTFSFTLSLVLLLTLAFAVWSAFFFARRLTAPILDLARGTRAVSMGDYDQRIDSPEDDELGRLVDLFNDMTERLAAARDAAASSRREVEAQHAYLEALLSHLSSGVLSLDADGVLRTVNTAADAILVTRIEPYLGHGVQAVCRQNATLAAFFKPLTPWFQGDASRWSRELSVMTDAGRKDLVCRGARLPGHGGHVVVFDDVTELLHAQRDAAWGEMAQRLAHEIKNPLTPIQLSAERLRRRCLPQIEGESAEVLDRSIRTIVAQVDNMKALVNAFSQYARLPKATLGLLDLNEVVRQVASLYHSDDAVADRAQVALALSTTPAWMAADDGQLRQMLHNLIKNAGEALAGRRDGRIVIGTAVTLQQGERRIELRVADNGPGIAPELMSTVFEPYVTNKLKGTGLGLAIVKKIVEEHGGIIRPGVVAGGGAYFLAQFPAAKT